MSKDKPIQNISQLRDFALDTLQKLANGEIDTATAGVSGKLCENVVSTIKTQLEYSRMLDEPPSIAFMDVNDGKNLLEHDKPVKKLGYSAK